LLENKNHIILKPGAEPTPGWFLQFYQFWITFVIQNWH